MGAADGDGVAAGCTARVPAASTSESWRGSRVKVRVRVSEGLREMRWKPVS